MTSVDSSSINVQDFKPLIDALNKEVDNRNGDWASSFNDANQGSGFSVEYNDDTNEFTFTTPDGKTDPLDTQETAAFLAENPDLEAGDLPFASSTSSEPSEPSETTQEASQDVAAANKAVRDAWFDILT